MANSPSTESDASNNQVRARLITELDAARHTSERLADELKEALDSTSVIQEDRDSARQMYEQGKRALEVAQAAVDRFDAGKYGLCTRCGEAIAPERLEALPETALCRDCSAGVA